MKRLVLCGWTDGYSGYGQHIAAVVRYFVHQGREVVVRPLKHSEKFGHIDPLVAERLVWDMQPEPWEVMITPPSVPVSGKRCVYYTMWETTALHQNLVDLLNKAEVVVVPCQWNAETFKTSGVKKPIVIVPLGVDLKYFFPGPMNMRGPCVFGCAGRLAHGEIRKGVGAVVAAFLRAFPNDDGVRLRVKAFSDDALPDTSDRRIDVVREFLSDDELADWMRSLTAFVSLARGEGWGLMQHQALCCGRPLIVPLYGGLREFADDTNSWSVPYVEVKPEEANQYFASGKWAKPNREVAGICMQDVARYREAAWYKGLQNHKAMSFSWKNSLEKLEKTLTGLGVL